MTTLKSSNADSNHRFAWDGFSFEVPASWNFSEYTLRRNISQVQMEDDSAIRLDMEWFNPSKPVPPARLQTRYAKVAKTLTDAGATTTVVDQLPEGWSAFLYSLPDTRHLLTAFRLLPTINFFCFFRLHFLRASRREPIRIIRHLASTFQLHQERMIPWQFYNVSFKLDRDFRLINTSLQAGRQLMIFEWRLRRFFIWFFSVGDVLLKESKSKSLESWCADVLNRFRDIKGPKFKAGRQGVIDVGRSLRYPLRHGEEIVRLCFRYHARCMLLWETKQIVIYVFNYRKESDLEKIKEGLPWR